MTTTAYLGAIPEDESNNEHMTLFFLGTTFDERKNGFEKYADGLTKIICPFEAKIIGRQRMGPQQKSVLILAVPHRVHVVVYKFKWLHQGDPEQIANWQPHITIKDRDILAPRSIGDTVLFTSVQARP